jgi:ribonuclease T1
MSRLISLRFVLTGFLFAAALGSGVAQSKSPAFIDHQVAVKVAELPRQGIQIYDLIQRGGPFAHEKDGIVFGNREHLLPIQKRGYYHEYTVATPGSHSRGTRRIVCGGPLKAPDICYYTADHYGSFRKIVP